MDNIETIISDISRKTDDNITSIILLYGDPSFSIERNANMLESSVGCSLCTKRLESPHFTEI